MIAGPIPAPILDVHIGILQREAQRSGEQQKSIRKSSLRRRRSRSPVACRLPRDVSNAPHGVVRPQDIDHHPMAL
jgi:hypothetical protein